MPEGQRIPLGAVVAAGVTLVASPALLGGLGWTRAETTARFDPLLSLCLSSASPRSLGDLAGAWSLAPQVLLPLALAAMLYLRRQRRDPGSANERLAFAAGMSLLVVALLSPLCRLAAMSATAHMVQHLIVVALAPPLLVIGLGSYWPRVDGAAEAGWLRPLMRPGPATLVYAVTVWLVHVPAVYQTALRDPSLHLAVLAAELLAGLAFWAALVQAGRSADERGRAGGALAAAAATFMHTGLLGALLTLSPRPWYPIFQAEAPLLGLAPLQDQQLAGLIMWVPMGGIFFATGMLLLARLLGGGQRLSFAGD